MDAALQTFVASESNKCRKMAERLFMWKKNRRNNLISVRWLLQLPGYGKRSAWQPMLSTQKLSFENNLHINPTNLE
jgi:hypothetical protein